MTFAGLPILKDIVELHVYDEEIARHYAAYRPPLHQLILAEVLDGRHFDRGLDIGCGTGYSAIALAEHCDHVIGVDQSQSMLDKATKHPKVEYRLGTGEELPVAPNSIDLITLAGVLFYLNAEKTIAGLSQTCRKDALIVPYDFEVQIQELMLLFDLSEDGDNGIYDHECNLSGMAGVSTLKQVTRTVEFDVNHREAAHILLSDKLRHTPLADQYNTTDPFDQVVDKLKQMDWQGKLKANIFYSVHQLAS